LQHSLDNVTLSSAKNFIKQGVYPTVSICKKKFIINICFDQRGMPMIKCKYIKSMLHSQKLSDFCRFFILWL